ncbi:trehalose operon repressor [Aerococcaceae bacterium DSM 111020]|nr:trehalose operon repressor [Aerococcaceae bacterium DSM 111020]
MKKFEQIYNDLEEKILTGIFPMSTLLPSENDLADYYQVSRGTIRQSLKKLEQHGYIIKRQGKGNIVINHSAFTLPISGIKSYKEIAQEHQLDVKTKVLFNQRVKAPSFITNVIDISKDEEFIHLIRLRQINGETQIIDHDYILASIVPHIPHHKAKDSIYQYFEQDLGLEISYAHKEFYVAPTDTIDQEHFNIGPDDFVVTVNSFVYLNDTSFFQYTTSHHRLETFKFQEIARR